MNRTVCSTAHPTSGSWRTRTRPWTRTTSIPARNITKNHREKMMWIYVLWAIFSLKILVNIVSQCPNLQNLSCVRPRINFNKSFWFIFINMIRSSYSWIFDRKDPDPYFYALYMIQIRLSWVWIRIWWKWIHSPGFAHFLCWTHGKQERNCVVDGAGLRGSL